MGNAGCRVIAGLCSGTHQVPDPATRSNSTCRDITAKVSVTIMVQVQTFSPAQSDPPVRVSVGTRAPPLAGAPFAPEADAESPAAGVSVRRRFAARAASSPVC